MSVRLHGISSDGVSADVVSLLNGKLSSMVANEQGSFARDPKFISGFVIRLNEEDLNELGSIDVRIGDHLHRVPRERLEGYFSIVQDAGRVSLRSSDRFFVDRSALPFIDRCMTWKGDLKVLRMALGGHLPILIYNALFALVFLGVPSWLSAGRRDDHVLARLAAAFFPKPSSTDGERLAAKHRCRAGYRIASAILAVLCGFLFVNQALPGESYPSDLRHHTKMIGSGYSFLHLLLGATRSAFEALAHGSSDHLPSLLMAGLLTLSVMLVSVTLSIYFTRRYDSVSPCLSDFFSIALVLVSMGIYDPWNIGGLYHGIATPNVWHNPTLIFCRVFSLGVFIVLTRLLDRAAERRLRIGPFVLLAVFSFFSMWAKPSFLITFLPAAAVIVPYLLVRRRIRLEVAVLAGVAMSVSLIPLWLIYSKVSASSGSSGAIVFAFNAAQSNLIRFPLDLVLSSAFPLFVVWNVARTRRRVSTGLSLAFVNYIFSMLIRFFVTESGDRMRHGNFGWSYSIALFFMFFAAVEEFYFTRRDDSRVVRLAGNALFSWHLVSGMYYLAIVLLGYSYK